MKNIDLPSSYKSNLRLCQSYSSLGQWPDHVGSRGWYKTHSTASVLFSQYPIFTGKSKSVREFDWTQMAGNSSEMTVAKLNHRTWVSPYSIRIEAHRKDSLSSSRPASPSSIDCSLTGMEIYMTSVKQVINLQQLLYIFNGFEGAVGEK